MTILDADDAYHLQRLERLFAAYPNDGERTILGDHWMLCLSRNVALVPWKMGENFPFCIDLYDFLIYKPFLVQPLFPSRVRDLGIRYPAYFAAEDAIFMCRMLAQGYLLRLHPDPLYFYRLRNGSLSHDLSGIKATEVAFTALLEELDPVLNEKSRRAVEDIINTAIKDSHYLPVLEALRHKRYGKAARQIFADRFCRTEFLRRLYPSVLKRLRVLRFPDTTGR